MSSSDPANTLPLRLHFLLAAAVAWACSSPPSGARLPLDLHVDHPAGQERVEDFETLVPRGPVTTEGPSVVVERVSAAVPWPRGLAWVDGRLVVLARGRHRRAGGIDPAVPDRCGSLFLVDPEIAEPIVPGRLASPRIAANAVLLASPTDPPLRLYDASRPLPRNTLVDRPYCTLIHDPISHNLFVCGYSGVDLPGGRFRKNATDSILRYDLRDRRWHVVEQHEPSVVPAAALTRVVPNTFYPHHDPSRRPPPHGWLNGPDGGCVAGRYLYCVGKDNHAVARYDLQRIREDPSAPPPPSELVLGPRVLLRHPGGERRVELLGPSAAVAHGGFLYLGYRTSSVVVRVPLTPRGDLVRPVVAELVAVFEPWDPVRRRSANLIDLAFDRAGALYVSCAKEGRIWKIDDPDPRRPFYGNDRSGRPTTAPPWVDLRRVTGRPTACGNLLVDPEDRVYVCVGNYDRDRELAGAIYRCTERRTGRRASGALRGRAGLDRKAKRAIVRGTPGLDRSERAHDPDRDP